MDALHWSHTSLYVPPREHLRYLRGVPRRLRVRRSLRLDLPGDRDEVRRDVVQDPRGVRFHRRRVRVAKALALVLVERSLAHALATHARVQTPRALFAHLCRGEVVVVPLVAARAEGSEARDFFRLALLHEILARHVRRLLHALVAALPLAVDEVQLYALLRDLLGVVLVASRGALRRQPVLVAVIHRLPPGQHRASNRAVIAVTLRRRDDLLRGLARLRARARRRRLRLLRARRLRPRRRRRHLL